jgi:hypothetical protein
LKPFFNTKKGRKTLGHMLNEKPDPSVKIEKNEKTGKKKETETVFNIDKFLN